MGETPRRLLVARAVMRQMRSKGMTVVQFAELAGMSVEDLLSRLTGEVAFDVDELQVIATGLGIEWGQFFRDGG